MVDPATPFSTHTFSDDQLLEGEEVILIVDDYPDIVVLIRNFLHKNGFLSESASSGEELRRMIKQKPVALVLLDIGLPDVIGTELIPEIKTVSSDTSIIMLSAETNLQTALECLRYGADDYLSKPVQYASFIETLRKVLEKRRLQINNFRYQKELEQAHFRLQLLHQLAMKMNSAYLSMTALDEILQAVLVGITADEGLGFNRAFLALFDKSGRVLEGRMAIGPGCREDAGRIWEEITSKQLRFNEIIDSIKGHCFHRDSEVNVIARALRVEADQTDHLLIRAVEERRTINVVNGGSDCAVPLELMGLLQEDCFVAVPLYSPNHSLGVIIADHFVTGKKIEDDQVKALESFASQASLAIEHFRLYKAMENKIKELESVTHELEKNKDLLVDAERYSAVGHMAAQLAHSIRNPITFIGGTARLLARKTDNPERLKFLDMMTSEAVKIEHILEDLFDFVEDTTPKKEPVQVCSLLNKSVMLFYPTMEKQGVELELRLPENEPTCDLDPELMRRVFVHLLRNAIDAMQDGGQLVIEVIIEPEQVRIDVRDRGTGIEEADLQRVADPFYTTKTVGTGMGLVLVQRIVADHGGKLTISKREKGGTEATIVLPL